MRVRFATNLFVPSLITRRSKDPQTQQIIAGARNAEGGFVDSMKIAEEQLAQGLASGSDSTPESSLTNTTIAVVATNIKLTKVLSNQSRPDGP